MRNNQFKPAILVSLAMSYYGLGKYDKAFSTVQAAQAAIKEVTRKPVDKYGRIPINLNKEACSASLKVIDGLCLKKQGKFEEAYGLLYLAFYEISVKVYKVTTLELHSVT